MDDWRMKYQLLEEEQERHRAKFLLLKDQYTRGCEEARKYRAEIADLKERGNDISQQRDEFEAKYVGLMETYQEAITRKNKVYKARKKQLKAANFKIKQLLERVSMLSSQKKEIHSNLELIQNERDQLSTQIIDLGGKSKEMRNHLRLVIDERDKLTQQIAALSQGENPYEGRVDSLN